MNSPREKHNLFYFSTFRRLPPLLARIYVQRDQHVDHLGDVVEHVAPNDSLLVADVALALLTVQLTDPLHLLATDLKSCFLGRSRIQIEAGHAALHSTYSRLGFVVRVAESREQVEVVRSFEASGAAGRCVRLLETPGKMENSLSILVGS